MLFPIPALYTEAAGLCRDCPMENVQFTLWLNPFPPRRFAYIRYSYYSYEEDVSLAPAVPDL
jgi:hypothetical protein